MVSGRHCTAEDTENAEEGKKRLTTETTEKTESME